MRGSRSSEIQPKGGSIRAMQISAKDHLLDEMSGVFLFRKNKGATSVYIARPKLISFFKTENHLVSNMAKTRGPGSRVTRGGRGGFAGSLVGVRRSARLAVGGGCRSPPSAGSELSAGSSQSRLPSSQSPVSATACLSPQQSPAWPLDSPHSGQQLPACSLPSAVPPASIQRPSLPLKPGSHPPFVLPLPPQSKPLLPSPVTPKFHLLSFLSYSSS